MTVSLLFGTGCGSVKKATAEERAASFAAVEAIAVGSDRIGDYVLKRTAFIVCGADLRGFEQSSSTSTVFGASVGEYLDFGSAAAVDRRGYFVTAAHCLDGAKIRIGFLTKTGVQVPEARVVFKGDPMSGVSDFAVLHIPMSLEHIFEWGTGFKTGDTVISAGTSRHGTSNPSHLSLNVEPVGGRIEKIVSETADGVGYQRILHNSPLARGNSGGPLVDKNGRLLGVNIEGAAALPAFHPKHRFAVAVQPDLNWIKRVIEQDAARQAKPAS